MNKLLPILMLLALSCDKSAEKQFWIKEITENRNDFLFMVENTNVPDTSADSLQLFLNEDEYWGTRLMESAAYVGDTILPKVVSFKKFQDLKTNGDFRAIVLLRDGDEENRNYRFLIRTYTNDWKQIDSYEFAVWDQNVDKFCYGSINEDLIIEKKCDGSETSEIMMVTEKGEIVLASYHEP